MASTNSRLPGEPPSARRLLRSTVLAFVVAVGLLVTVVLPAEYGVDPTGIGRVLGLQEMGRIKVALAREAEAEAAAEPAVAVPPAASLQAPAAGGLMRSDTTVVTVAPNRGIEVKLVMDSGAQATYVWRTDRGVVNSELHGDSLNAPANDYISYRKRLAVPADSGQFTAAFDGFHGWFWRNRTGEAVTITLHTRGAYREVKGP